MSYYEDLTPYDYFARHEPEGIRAVNVGWLSREHPFVKGGTSPQFQGRLLHFCQDSHIVHLARGFHTCDFCVTTSELWFAGAKSRYGPSAHWASIGDGEIRVFAGGDVFAAPALIYHYVVEHGYLPPKLFIEAVLTGPQPGTGEYQALLARWRSPNRLTRR